MSDINDLFAKLKKADAGSRELSDAVLLACGWVHKIENGDPRTEAWIAPDGTPYDYWDDPHARSREPIPHRPSPTESLDAALQLVPEGWWWEAQRYGGATGTSRGCYLWRFYTAAPESKEYKIVTGHGLTAAIACASGALKARQAA